MALAAVGAPSIAARADDSTGPAASRAFLFGGVDAGQNSGFAWTGITAIPFGTILEDGLRLRAMGGYGQYKYQTPAAPNGKNKGTVSSGELLVGYHATFDATVITSYFGLDARNYSLQSADPGNPETGSHVGVKTAIELYTRTASDWFATAYGNISSVFQNYSVRAALHNELAPGFALGAEGGLLGDKRYNEQRAGLIATMTFAKASLSVASGVAQNSDNGSGTYTTVTLYAPF